MSLFILTFLLVYSSLHLYVFLKARAAFNFGMQMSFFLGLFMLLMITSPIIIRLSERAGMETFARYLSYIGFTWMGILVLFISVSLVIDVYRLILFISGLVLKKNLSNIMISNTYAFLIPLSIAIIVTIYGYFEAKNIKTERAVIKTEKIPEKIGKLKIVQISDIHLGLIVREERLKNILNIVKRENPDIFVSTGDLVDGLSDNLTEVEALLNEITPRYGKYAITGNHEFYAGLEQALHFTEKTGFTILRAERITVGDIINIAGVDDPAGKQFNVYKDISEKELLMGLPQNNFTILLKHRPVVNNDALGLFDLQLSGHVHKGQIFPLGIITGLIYPVQEGLAHLPDNSYLYVSRGTGTWGPPIRVLSPPEVTVIELVHPEDFT